LIQSAQNARKLPSGLDWSNSAVICNKLPAAATHHSNAPYEAQHAATSDGKAPSFEVLFDGSNRCKQVL
jgi:hypothetical protein